MTRLTRTILKSRGIAGFEKGTRRPVTIDELPATFRKTRLMAYIELKYNKPIATIVYDGTIYDVAAKYGIDFTTVSKWRKLIREATNEA
jgi:transposase-like protein